MKRLCYFVALIALSSSAHADSFSFAVAGRSIRIEASRHCRAASCVAVSIPGIYRSKRWHDRDDEVAAAPAPANPPARAVVPVVAPAAPASQPPVQPVASAPPPPAPPPVPVPPFASTTTAQIIVLPAPPPKLEPIKATPVEAPPVVAPAPIPVPTPPIAEVAQQTEDEPADTPIGDWQTEGNKGTVRIERCGEAMCGYVLALTPNAKGDTVLINMKPSTNIVKSDTVWSGNIYSRSSGDIYHATMTLKGTNTLRVQACALGRFFCSGNDWTRIVTNPDKLITSQISPRPPS
jgi:uncharacterized protein (DUF2147 family)